MTANDNSTKPLRIVLIRRGNKVAKNIPTRHLVPFILKKKLRPSDEISGDGSKWMRLDRHYQLVRYFGEDTGSGPSGLSSSFLPDTYSEPEWDPFESVEEFEPTSSPPPNPAVENELAQLAQMLKDLSQ